MKLCIYSQSSLNSRSTLRAVYSSLRVITISYHLSVYSIYYVSQTSRILRKHTTQLRYASILKYICIYIYTISLIIIIICTGQYLHDTTNYIAFDSSYSMYCVLCIQIYVYYVSNFTSLSFRVTLFALYTYLYVIHIVCIFVVRLVYVFLLHNIPFYQHLNYIENTVITMFRFADILEHRSMDCRSYSQCTYYIIYAIRIRHLLI